MKIASKLLDVRRLVAALALALLVLACSDRPARAGYVLGFGQAVYNTSVGQLVNVSVFLTETDNLNILNNEGLNGAGLSLSFNLAPRAASPAQVLLITPNPGTDPASDIISTSITPATATTTGIATFRFSQFLDPALSASGTSSILLGTFEFRAGTVNGDVTNLGLSVLTPGNQFVTGTGRILDASITTGTGRIVVGAVVPEPGTLTLCLAGLPVLLAWRLATRPRAA